MSESSALVNQSKPWSSEARWEIVGAEAVVLAVGGLFTLLNTDRAADWMMQIIGLVFMIVSLQLAIAAFRGTGTPLGKFDTFRAGIGVTVGVIATSLWWSDAVTNNAVRLILGWGLVAFATLHLVGGVVVRGRENLRLASLLGSALTLVLGILLLTSRNATSDGRLTFFGIVLLVAGVLLGGLAYLIKGRVRPAGAA